MLLKERRAFSFARVVNSVPVPGVDEVVSVFHGAVRSTAVPMRVLAISVGVVCAIAAMCLALDTFWQVYLAGFPDGHATDYDKAVEGPLRILTSVEAGLGLLFVFLALSSIRAARAVGLLVALIALVLVAALVHVGVPWYFGTHLGLDNGIGG